METLEVFGCNSRAAYRQFSIKAMAATLLILSIRLGLGEASDLVDLSERSSEGEKAPTTQFMSHTYFRSANPIGRGYALENGTKMDSQQLTTLFLLASQIESPSHSSEPTRVRPVRPLLDVRQSGIAQPSPPDTIEQRTEPSFSRRRAKPRG